MIYGEIMNKNEQKLVERIYDKYSNKTKEKKSVDYLVELDKRISRPAQIFAITFGVIASLILGTGMCMCMEQIAGGMILGIIVGCFGILMTCITYPIYKAILEKSMKAYKNEILSISEKLLHSEKQKD